MLLQICRHLHIVTRIMKNQANVISPREHNKLLVSPLKGKEIQDLLDIEFKIIAIEIIRELQENKINCDKIRNSIQEKIRTSTKR